MNLERLLALVVVLMAAPYVLGRWKYALEAVAALCGGLAAYWLLGSLL